MTYGEMNNYITHVSDNDLAALCKSVYEFKNGNGVLEPTSTLKILAENLQFSDVRALECAITEEAHSCRSLSRPGKHRSTDILRPCRIYASTRHKRHEQSCSSENL